jgi:hypothetical protein
MRAVSRQQLAAIHTLKSQLGLDDETYRSMLASQTGKASAKALDGNQAFKVITHLRGLAGEPQSPVETDLNGPYGAIARALWISAWHLGVVDKRDDAALLAFVRRQTRIDHLRWVRDAAEGAAVIEALKAILARDAGVVWPARKGDSAEARKRAVYAAQQAMLGVQLPDPAEADLHGAIAGLGRKIRAAKKRGSK